MKYSGGDTPESDASLAIVGMSCRLPGAEDIREFWQNLINGVESLTTFSDEELLASGIHPSWLDNPRYVKANAILKDVTSFDADFFDVPPREAELLDPQQRLLLELAWEALESAAVDPYNYAGNISFFAGTRVSEYLMFNQDAIDPFGFTTESPILVTQRRWSNQVDFLATRVSFKLNLRGPALAVQTACSTSMVAIHLAAESLLSGESDVALAGGVTIRVPQRAGYVYSEGMIFTPDGHTRSFDAQAQGTIFSSGGGIIALKRLQDAIAENDHIFAVIRGTAVNNDGGGDKTKFSAPAVSGQSAVISQALQKTDIDPSTITYVEAHGTATAAGDPIEVAGLTDAYRQKTDKREYCAIGSVKSNIGHTVQAAGVIGVIKVALMLQHKSLVPSINFSAPNPRIDFASSPFYVNTEYRPWPAAETPRRAGVSSFGVGGTNAHLIMEEAPPVPAKPPVVGSEFMLPLSAKSENALRDLAQAYDHFFKTNPEVDLADVCFTAANGRAHFDHRLAVLAESTVQMREKLRAYLNNEKLEGVFHGRVTEEKNKAAFLFTGQGAQYANMGRGLYESEPVFRATMDRCAALLEPYLERPLLAVLYPDEGAKDAPIHQTAYTQPALFALEYSLAALWESWGIRPAYVLGHSIGEYAAACVAGIMSLEDGLRLIAERGRLMQNLAQDGKMAAIFADEERVAEIITPYENDLSIAAVNGPTNTVISGRSDALDEAVALLEATGIVTRPLTTSHAFHSRLMEPMMDAFEQAAQDIDQTAPRVPLLSNVTGKPFDENTQPDAAYWRDHVRSTVRFGSAIDYLAAAGCTTFLEIGPDPTLLGMARRCVPDLDAAWLPSLRKKQDDGRQMRRSLAHLYVSGAPLQGMLPESGRRIQLPTYPFQRKRYWIEPKRRGKQAAELPDLLTGAVHPLLGRRLASPLAEIQYVAEIDVAAAPFLADHRVFDVITMPATAYIEMAHAAAAAFFGEGTSQIHIKDLVIHQPLFFPQGEESSVQLVLSPGESGLSAFGIYSLSDRENNAWTLHANGMVVGRARDEIDPAEELTSVQARLKEKVQLDNFYDKKRSLGIHFGPTFKGVRDLWRSDGEALARIRLPRSASDGQEVFRIHPALLDAAIQTVGAAVDGEAETLYLPVVLEQIAFLGHVPNELWCHTKLREHKGSSRELRTADLDLFDDDGRLVVRVEGLSFKRARSEALLRSVTPDPEREWLYRIEWQRKLMSDAEKAEGGPVDSWIIFADKEGMGSSLAARLEGLGHKALLVAPIGSRAADEVDSTAVRLADAGEADALIAQYAAGSGSAKTGILYLAGIDTADYGPADPDSVVNKQEAALGGLLRLVQTVNAVYAGTTSSPRLWVLTRGAQAVGSQPGPYSVAQSPLWGLGKVIAREHPELAPTLIDIDPADDELDDLLAELQAGSEERQIAFRGDARYVARLAPQFGDRGEQLQHLAFPEPPVYRLVCREPGTFDGLELAPMERHVPGPDEVEIEIHASGLNFRDVLIALGRFDDVIGRECSGVVTTCGKDVTHVAAGDMVMAVAPQSFASYVTVKGHHVVKMPRNLSFAETATIPMVFLTAYYGLHTLAQMKAGDRVLIHAAAGGVGHAAVQLAQQSGAEIYATASRKKWPYLRSLGLTNILDSRSLDFTDEILRLTDSAGVDIVLNSLAGEFISKSLDALGENGRFIEIGATDVWDQAQIKAVRPDVEYHWFHLGQSVAQKNPDFFLALFQQMAAGFASGAYRPLPHFSFQIRDAGEAFRFMAQAKHIGKVVLTRREPREDARQDEQLKLRQNGAYLVTGGLGGLGLKIAGWLADRGARHIALLGRSAPSEAAGAVLSDLRDRGVQTRVVQADVADLGALMAALAQVEEDMPVLSGVIHAAGVVEDGILQQQDWARFQKVLAPKVTGAWNLHRLTEHLPLDFFILFSSVSSLWGGAGQGNYAAANTFLDTLAHYRRSRGLKGLSINWGAWSEVGMAADLGEAVERRRAISGMGKIDPDLGLAILDRVMRLDQAQIGVIPADWPLYRSQFPDELQKTFLSQLAPQRKKIDQKPADGAAHESDLLLRLQSAEPDQKTAILFDYMRSVISRIGGMDAHHLGMEDALDEMGIDSLMAIELRNQLVADLACDIPMNELLRNPSLADLAALLLAKSAPTPETIEEARAPEKTPAKWTPVVPLSPGGTKLPVFLVHGIGGHPMTYSKLARYLDEDQPFYTFQAQGLDGRAQSVNSVEEMAAQYIEAMRSIQPDGPYVLGGYSFGSYVAHEMACQLVEDGIEVGALISFDGVVRKLILNMISMNQRDKARYYAKDLRVRYDFHNKQMQDISLRDRFGYVNALLQRKFQGKRDPDLTQVSLTDDSEVSTILKHMRSNNKRILLAYQPRRYPGKITFFSAEETHVHHGWDFLTTSGVDVIKVPGGHHTIMHEPHVRILAAELQKLLDRIDEAYGNVNRRTADQKASTTRAAGR